MTVVSPPDLSMASHSTHRYERKFVVQEGHSAEILALVRHHPALFREIYHQRAINNLYLDTPGRAHYQDHVHGLANRLKVRIRWYGPLHGHVERPVLERKIKAGSVATKASNLLASFTLNGTFPLQTITHALQSSELDPQMRHGLGYLDPSLVNRYQRRYFLSADSHFRLTMDTGLECYGLSRTTGHLFPIPGAYPSVILELKFDAQHATTAAQVTNAFPFRLTRCSKYVLGMDALHAII
jgi:hypothetical protein